MAASAALDAAVWRPPELSVIWLLVLHRRPGVLGGLASVALAGPVETAEYPPLAALFAWLPTWYLRPIDVASAA